MGRKRTPQHSSLADENQVFIETTDYAQATLYGLFGMKVEPFRGSNGRVAFRVYGEVTEVQQKIIANTPVGCLDFIRELKLIRSMLFTTR